MNQPKGLTVTFQPEGRRAAIPFGTTVLAAARKAGVSLPTRCGGKAGCLMCKISVAEEDATLLQPPGDVERRKLGDLLEQGVRLACQSVICGDLSVVIPEDPLKAAVRRRLEEARRGEQDRLW